ncbi:MAG: hypothetical protein QOH47_2891 [Sphingomonadales bacterium]|nr:hypothetical protein [Sphingomonadales bacterium]
MSAFRILAYAFVSVCGLIVIAGLPGCSVFPSDIDNSRKRDVVGCYYVEDDLVLEATLDDLRLSERERMAYSVASHNIGLALLPASKLRLRTGRNGRWELFQIAGNSEFVPYQNAGAGGLALTGIDGRVTLSRRRPCRRELR